MKRFSLLSAGFLAALMFASVGCDVDVEEPGRAPEVDVSGDPGAMPEMDVEGPEVDASMEEKEVEVPDVNVDTETRTTEVPDVDVSTPNNDEAEVTQP